jgi:hypothetical protein
MTTLKGGKQTDQLRPRTQVLEIKSVVVHFQDKAFNSGCLLADVGGGSTDKGT